MPTIHRLSGIGVAFWLAACGSPQASAPSATPVSPAERLSSIVERYWAERAAQPQLSPQSLADALANERESFTEALAVAPDGLDAGSRLTRDIFLRRRARLIEGYTYPSELLPVEPFDSPPLAFARAAAKAAEGELSTAADYEGWLRRTDEQVLWMQQAIVNMREGVRRGYTVPRVLIERALPLLATLGEEGPGNIFYGPIHTLPATIEEHARAEFATRLSEAVRERLLPAYRHLYDYLKSDYLPKARKSLPLSALPLGASWYSYRVELATGTKLSAAQIHTLGVAEVARLKTQLQALQGGTSPEAGVDPIAAAEDLKSKVLTAEPVLFSDLPGADFEIRAFTPRYDEGEMSYQAANPSYHRPAVLFVAAASAAGMVQGISIPDFLQAALPGRHLQSALQQERTDLPKFRRYESDPAFVQGWALYASSLGEEMGLYTDQQSKRAALVRQWQCAAALVVDTGIQTQRWSRDKAVEYLRTELSLDDVQARATADRYIAQPGDALACKMGEMHIRALRTSAQQALGSRFDVRDFHQQLLKDGSMPLDILDAKMKAWMQAAR